MFRLFKYQKRSLTRQRPMDEEILALIKFKTIKI